MHLGSILGGIFQHYGALGEKLGILETRRHYGPYFRGLPGVKEFRKILVTSMIIKELHDTLSQVESRYQGF